MADSGERTRLNCLLAALPERELAAVRAHSEEVELSQRETLYEAGEILEHVWFPHTGVVSLVTEFKAGQPVEIATVGSEGMAGLPLLLGSDQIASRAFVQVPGTGARIGADAFRSLLPECPAFEQLLRRYTLALINQIGQNAACNRTHTVEERCARWLLMTQDRVYQPTFPLTQEFLGQRLGVRRPTVSLAVGMLQKAGLIHYVRGEITVLDRSGLEGAACECYGIIRGEFERLVGTAG
jgi:CRP-like cAMP-binding protein